LRTADFAGSPVIAASLLTPIELKYIGFYWGIVGNNPPFFVNLPMKVGHDVSRFGTHLAN